MSNKVAKRPSDDKVNGNLSPPSKIQKDEDSPENLSHDERLARMKDFFSKGGPKPPPPKPKPKRPSLINTEATDGDTDQTPPPMSPDSPGMEDPGPIILNIDSLNQLSTIMEIDLDAVVRQQEILENQAQKDRAALSQSKGLQSRRLPKHLASKVPDDYSERRRAQTYSSSELKGSRSAMDETDSAGERACTPEVSEEERKQKILARSGVSQGSNPLAALGSILKRRNSLRGNKTPKSPKSPKKSVTESPRSTPKMKKKNSLEANDLQRLGVEPPKSPKGFLSSLRRSTSRGSGRKKGKFDASISATASASTSVEDLRAETSSLISLPINPSTRTNDVPMDTSTPIKKAEPKDVSVSTSSSHPVNVSGASKNVSSYRSPVHDRPRDSSLFKEASVERLFESDSSNLFGSGELEALLGKEKEKEKSPERPPVPEAKPSPTRNQEKPAKSPEPIRPNVVVDPAPKRTLQSRSESKGSIRSRLQAYEQSSKAKPATDSVSESPVSNKAENKEPEKVEEKKTEVATKPSSEKKTNRLFDDLEDDDLFGTSDTPSSPAKSSVQSDLAKKKASLFEDELFQEDIPKTQTPTKKEPPKVKPKKPKKSLGESPKREIRDSPLRKASDTVTSTDLSNIPDQSETESPKTEIRDSPKREIHSSPIRKASDPVKSPEPVSPKHKPVVSPPPEPTVSIDTSKPATSPPPKEEKEDKKPKKETGVTSSFFDDGSEMPVYGLRRKARGAREKTEPKKEIKIEEKSPPPEKPSTGGLFDDDSNDLPPFGLRRRGDRKKETLSNGDSSLKTEPAKRKGLFDDLEDDTYNGQTSTRQAPKEEVDSVADSLFDDIDKELDKDDTSVEIKTEVPSEPKSDPLGVVEEKTKIEKESEEREKEKKLVKDTTEDLFGNDKDEPKISTEEPSPELRVKSPTPEREDAEPADKEPESKPEEKKAGTKSSVTTRNRSATERSTSGTTRSRDIGRSPDRKGKEKEVPSWMSELKKRREGKDTKDKVPTPTTQKKTTKTTTKDEVVPDWQKRVQERRKNKAGDTGKTTKLASSSPKLDKPSSRTGRTSPSPRSTSDRTKSPTAGRKSPIAGRKSPLSGRKSPRSTETTTEKKSTYTSRYARNKDERDFSKSVDVTSSRRKTDKEKDSWKTSSSKDEKPSKIKEETDSDKTAKPKTTRKPSIEVVSKKISTSSTKSSVSSPEPTTKQDTKQVEGEDDVFVEGKKADVVSKEDTKESSPSPKLSGDLLSSVLDTDSGGANSPTDQLTKDSKSEEVKRESATSPVNDEKSRHSSASSEREQTDTPPFRSHSISHSRSPTPTSPTGPLKMPSEPELPAWKKRLLEKKKTGSSSSPATKRVEAKKTAENDLPAWKKDLLAKKQAKSPERKPRSATVASTRPTTSAGRSTAAGRRNKVQETPDFMKEFQKKKQKGKD